MIVWCGNLTILLSGLTFHCFWYRKQKTLCDSLHRPSRSDFVQFEFVRRITSAGESGYGAGEHAFARNAAQRYIRAQKTRSKCRRRFTALHHHTRTSRLRFSHSQFQIQTRRNEARTLSADTRLYSALLFESRCIFLFQKRKSDE